jgi:2-(1,2-epoxy-1,2-dihydrophenyl)acetyl-CoA isomerase
MTESLPVLCEVTDGVARITLNRPVALNAFDVTAAEAFFAAIDRLQSDATVRVVAISGAGKAFCSGGDLAAFIADPANAPKNARRLIDPLHGALMQMARMKPPIVAVVHGAAAGAGLSLVLACDLAIAADDTKFGSAYARVGASPDVGMTWALPRVVGLRKAMEIALLAENLDAAEALRLGLVNKVVPRAELEREADALVFRLARGPTAAYGRIKSLLRESSGRSLAEQLAAEAQAFSTGAATEDFREGIDAFFGKRGAQFRGR